MRTAIFTLTLNLILVLSVAAETPSYSVGVDYGFSGAAQKWSAWGRKGLELAIDEINSEGGVGGLPMRLIWEDSNTNPARSISAYKKLVAVDHVHAVIGSVWSILTNPLIPLTRSDKVILIAPTVMDASVDSESPYFFSLSPGVNSVRNPLRTFYGLRPDVKKAAFLCWDDRWGQENLKIWNEVSRERGVEIVFSECEQDYSSDFRLIVNKARAYAPDVLLVGMYAERVAERLRELNWQPLIYTTNCVEEALGEQSIDQSLLEGVFYAAWVPNKNFISAFRRKYNEEPQLQAEAHYEALKALATALNRPEKDLREALKRVKYNGVTGPIDFTQGPFANKSEAQLLTIKAGKAVPVN